MVIWLFGYSTETYNYIEQHIESFKSEVRSFTKLDINDQQILKQVLQRLIQKIEVFEGGKIRIYYNISSPPSLDDILN